MAQKRAEDKLSTNQDRFFSPVDDRLICLMRLILAFSALVIIYIDPSEPDRLVFVTYGALLFYNLYSVLLYVLALRSMTLPRSRLVHWIDVGCYLLLVSLSSGTSSTFFFFFFFAVLVASFRWGYREGLLVTIVSAILFTILGYATAISAPRFELNRFMLRPVYLLVLGYLMAYWGGAEIQLKKRLGLLKDVNTFSNPRFGIAQTIVTLMKRVLAFYEAREALLILVNPAAASEVQLTRVRSAAQGEEVERTSMPLELARQFFIAEETLAIIYKGRSRFWEQKERDYFASDVITGERSGRGKDEGSTVATLLDAESFITLPLIHRGRNVGRLFLTGDCGSFGESDIEFLQQVVELVMPVLSNIRLLDRLASNAAEHERQKIARDLHDSVIQPYIGLQYKLAAIRNKVHSGADDITSELDQLFETTVSEITGLRHYVHELKDAEMTRDHLVSAIRRYTEQFQENYGIDVDIICRGELEITDRLAAELIQMVHEGLRNIWKHTQATHCVVKLDLIDNSLVLCIANDNTPTETEFVSFRPRSIAERAESLGGSASVERDDKNQTVIRVQIPL